MAAPKPKPGHVRRNIVVTKVKRQQMAVEPPEAEEAIPVDEDLPLFEQRFCREYLKDSDAKQAAIRAGKSKDWAHSNAYHLVRDPLISAEIGRLRRKLIEKAEVTVERIVLELAKIGFANAGDFFDWGPDGVTVRSKDDLTLEQQAAVAEVCETTTKEGGTIRVKLHDKPGALEKLGKHLGMFTEKVDLTSGGKALQNLSDDQVLRLLEKALAKERDGKIADPPG